MVVGNIVARVGFSRATVGPCIACSLRSGVALAPEILYFVSLSIVTKQELQKPNQARNLKPSTFTRMAQQHHHESLSQHVQPYSEVGCGSLRCVLFVISSRLCCCSCPYSYDALLCAPVDCNSHTLKIVTEHNASTPRNRSSTQVLLSNPQPRTTIYNTSRTSNISQTLQETPSRRTQFSKSSHHQRNHSSSIQHILALH